MGLKELNQTNKKHYRGLDATYKNLSWVWSLDREIRPEDRRLTSRGMATDDKVTDFSFLPSHE